TYSPEGILYELVGKPQIGDRAAQRVVEDAEAGLAPPGPASTSAVGTERNPTVVLPGKLQTKPRDGNPDRHNKPTAWAQLLAHVEGREGATLLSTSFHGRTRDIALQLAADDHVTAQGYLHLRAADAPDGRLSTFSVIHLLEYPG